jgi:hypothetical protein
MQGETPDQIAESVQAANENSMLGGNEFGHALPQVSDDAGTPFTVVVIPGRRQSGY